jgi:hypothetical protein
VRRDGWRPAARDGSRTATIGVTIANCRGHCGRVKPAGPTTAVAGLGHPTRRYGSAWVFHVKHFWWDRATPDGSASAWRTSDAAVHVVGWDSVRLSRAPRDVPDWGPGHPKDPAHLHVCREQFQGSGSPADDCQWALSADRSLARTGRSTANDISLSRHSRAGALARGDEMFHVKHWARLLALIAEGHLDPCGASQRSVLVSVVAGPLWNLGCVRAWGTRILARACFT